MFMDGWHGKYEGGQCLVFVTNSLTMDTRGKLAGGLFVAWMMGILNSILGRARRVVARALPPAGSAMGAAALFALFTVQLMNAYGMMLLVMTYYAGFFFSIILGLALGNTVAQTMGAPSGAQVANKGAAEPLLGGGNGGGDIVDPCCPVDEDEDEGDIESTYASP
eukprot:g7772.t1